MVTGFEFCGSCGESFYYEDGHDCPMNEQPDKPIHFVDEKGIGRTHEEGLAGEYFTLCKIHNVVYYQEDGCLKCAEGA